jgi:RHS repeat-associated protein
LSDADSDGVLDTVIDGYTTKRRQAWSLDAVGNWVAFKQDAGDGSTWDLEQTREHNKANEIADTDDDQDAIGQGQGQPAWLDPAYDLAGNMTTGPKPDSPATPQVCTYDAWNRLMTVSEGSGTPTLIVTYSYDGLNRRIRKVLAVPNPDVTYDYYYNESWQVLEVRKGGDTDPLEQYVWGLQYIDAPVVRFRDGNLDGDLLDTQDNTDSTLYYTYDAQFNVTALVDTSGTPQERYVYDPYGKVKFLDGSWDAISDSAYDNQILYCGYRFDPESGLYHVRERYYDPVTGTWKTRDRILYPDGMNLYQYVRSSPTRRLDPLGLAGAETQPTQPTDPTAEGYAHPGPHGQPTLISTLKIIDNAKGPSVARVTVTTGKMYSSHIGSGRQTFLNNMDGGAEDEDDRDSAQVIVQSKDANGKALRKSNVVTVSEGRTKGATWEMVPNVPNDKEEGTIFAELVIIECATEVKVRVIYTDVEFGRGTGYNQDVPVLIASWDATKLTTWIIKNNYVPARGQKPVKDLIEKATDGTWTLMHRDFGEHDSGYDIVEKSPATQPTTNPVK